MPRSPPRTTPIEVIHLRYVAAISTTDFKMDAQYIARSILELTKEFGIVIASRVFEDH
jgi:DNA integrity scanning protein DisA with diadenylate cyclase activity